MAVGPREQLRRLASLLSPEHFHRAMVEVDLVSTPGLAERLDQNPLARLAVVLDEVVDVGAPALEVEVLPAQPEAGAFPVA